jgi:hypothetical protein
VWWRFQQGDPDAEAQLEKLREAKPLRKSRRISVRVVDRRGDPVAGAIVTAGASLAGGPHTAALASPDLASQLRRATTPGSGEVEIPDAPQDGMVIAESGDGKQRSIPKLIADTVTLTLEPTSRISGKVDLRGEPSSRIFLGIQDPKRKSTYRYEIVSPVSPDGTFSVVVPRARVRVFAATLTGVSKQLAAVDVDARKPVVDDVAITIANQKRVVQVIVRSTVATPVENAQVLVVRGVAKSTTLDKLELANTMTTINFARQVDLDKVPEAVRKLAQAGDMYTTIRGAPDGVASACAIGLPAVINDATLDSKASKHLDRVEVRCVEIPDGANAVVVEVPPWPRFD